MKIFDMRAALAAGVVLLGVAGQTSASTTLPNWAGYEFSTAGGLENPLVIVGFNPQPDPPGFPERPTLNIGDPFAPVLSQSTGTTFNFVLSFVGLPGGLLPAVDQPTFDTDIGRWTTNLDLDAGGNAFQVHLDFSGPGSSITWEAFNPQPDPPGAYTAYAIGFTGDASVKLTISENGAPLSFATVPEPSTWALTGLGFAVLGALSITFRKRLPQAA